MESAFSPHPKWRRNFMFTAAYTVKEPKYTLDPIITKPASLEFKPDPIIEHFNLVCVESTKS